MRELIRLKDLALARLETRVAHSIEVDDIKRQLDVSTRTHNSFLFYVFISLQFLSELVFTHTHTHTLSLSLSPSSSSLYQCLLCLLPCISSLLSPRLTLVKEERENHEKTKMALYNAQEKLKITVAELGNRTAALTAEKHQLEERLLGGTRRVSGKSVRGRE